MPRPRTGKTPVRNHRSPDEDWLPALARAIADGTTMTDVISPVVRDYGSTPPARDLTFTARPGALPWLNASYPGWRQAAAALEDTTAGLLSREYAGVALWLAITSNPRARKQQQRIIAGYAVLRAKTSSDTRWQEKHPGLPALIHAVISVLDEHLPPVSPPDKNRQAATSKGTDRD